MKSKCPIEYENKELLFVTMGTHSVFLILFSLGIWVGCVRKMSEGFVVVIEGAVVGFEIEVVIIEIWVVALEIPIVAVALAKAAVIRESIKTRSSRKYLIPCLPVLNPE